MAVATPNTIKPEQYQPTVAVSTPKTIAPAPYQPNAAVPTPKTIAPVTGVTQITTPQQPAVMAPQPTVTPPTGPTAQPVTPQQAVVQPTAQPTAATPREQYVAPLPQGGVPQLPTGFKAQGDAYSAQNVQQAVTAPTAKPDLSKTGVDLLNEFTNAPEIVEAQNRLQQLEAAQRAKYGEIDPMSVVTGEAALMQDEINAQRAFVDAKRGEAMQKYQIAQGQQDQINNLILQTGGRAGIKRTDSFETAVKKASKYSESEAEKSALKNLYTQTFGTTPGDMSEKKIRKKLEEAGIERQKAQDLIERQKAVSAGLDIATKEARIREIESRIEKNRQTGTITGKGQPAVKLSSSQIDALADFDATSEMASQLADLATGVNTGFISGRVGRFGQTLGVASDDFVQLNSGLALLKANFMKALSGAAVSEQEAERLANFLPDVNDDEGVIQVKLQQLQQEVERQKRSLLGNVGYSTAYGSQNDPLALGFEDNQFSDPLELGL